MLLFVLVLIDMISTEMVLKLDGVSETSAFIDLIHLEVGFAGLVGWAILVSLYFMFMMVALDKYGMKVQVESVIFVYMFSTFAAILNNASIYILQTVG